MGKHKPYQGHRNWNHWNVALWIANDEPLYRMADQAVRENPGNLDSAANALLLSLPAKTPDGAPYTFSSVRAALAHWNS